MPYIEAKLQRLYRLQADRNRNLNIIVMNENLSTLSYAIPHFVIGNSAMEKLDQNFFWRSAHIWIERIKE